MARLRELGWGQFEEAPEGRVAHLVSLPAADDTADSEEPFVKPVFGPVPPAFERAIVFNDALEEEHKEGDIGSHVDQPGDDDKHHVVPRSILSRQDDLAEQDTVLNEAHEDEPVRNEYVLGLLATARVRHKEEDKGDDDAREGNKIDVEV